MRRKIPSTTALAVFEAAARHQSYTKAADELAVTQSAVCRQIASLEDFLGVRLFQRSRRGVALTEAGEGYSRLVRSRLDEVERDALDLMSRGTPGGTLELGVVPTATKWLLPRLPAFTQQHPGIQVNLTAPDGAHPAIPVRRHALRCRDSRRRRRLARHRERVSDAGVPGRRVQPETGQCSTALHAQRLAAPNAAAAKYPPLCLAPLVRSSGLACRR